MAKPGTAGIVTNFALDLAEKVQTLQVRMPNIKVFSGSSHPDLAKKTVERLGKLQLAPCEQARVPVNIYRDILNRN